jgi:hypothetical protein
MASVDSKVTELLRGVGRIEDARAKGKREDPSYLLNDVKHFASSCALGSSPVEKKSFFSFIEDSVKIKILPWGYAEMGCEARAIKTCKTLRKQFPGSYIRKVCVRPVFEDFFESVLPDSLPVKYAAWGVHIACMVGVSSAEGPEKITLMVVDYTLSPEGPLPIEQWFRLLCKEMTSLDVAIGHPGVLVKDWGKRIILEPGYKDRVKEYTRTSLMDSEDALAQYRKSCKKPRFEP